MKKIRQPRHVGNLYPGESRRRSLVTAEGVNTRGDAPGLIAAENYIVSTHHLDGIWTHEVEYHGAVWKMPGKVFDALYRQRQSIIGAERKERAKTRFLKQVDTLVKSAD